MEFTVGMQVINYVGERARVIRVTPDGMVTLFGVESEWSHTFPGHFGGWRFDREAYASEHGWTLAELAQFESTYGVDAEELEAQRLRQDAEFKSLPPWERAPESHMG